MAVRPQPGLHPASGVARREADAVRMMTPLDHLTALRDEYKLKVAYALMHFEPAIIAVYIEHAAVIDKAIVKLEAKR
jgi:hypothetical protein